MQLRSVTGKPFEGSCQVSYTLVFWSQCKSEIQYGGCYGSYDIICSELRGRHVEQEEEESLQNKQLSYTRLVLGPCGLTTESQSATIFHFVWN